MQSIFRPTLRLFGDFYEIRKHPVTNLYYWASVNYGTLFGSYFVDIESALRFAKERVRIFGSGKAQLMGVENENK